ncbi:MAG: hypothetical protein AABX47_05675 [Nanoarchaeota archaeon]
MSVETTRMSSKGQIVIPLDIREAVLAGEGTIFAVAGIKDTIILKKVTTPEKEALLKEIGKIATEGRKRLEKNGLKETDIPTIVEKMRRKRY